MRFISKRHCGTITIESFLDVAGETKGLALRSHNRESISDIMETTLEGNYGLCEASLPPSRELATAR